ncbi:expressed unknown protein [Ectocarpus siliculosus]|uniref:Uncharacterized protein n=1 Tax=Ectocarpus siliculosus TaxID=2880 RepID=D7FWS1_ECTSI|nr:expressed unknown protein [Ectocarpus siliculosus]CBN76160.1 expressed unknown protein [Ectocarpus siliculosus]|eukprot:CBJ32159.1 expressed unknown protein [Ectocarpus siliculosus]
MVLYRQAANTVERWMGIRARTHMRCAVLATAAFVKANTWIRDYHRPSAHVRQKYPNGNHGGS